MWKVSKVHRGTEMLREPIPADVHAALLRWYTGHGSAAEEQIGVDLVQQLKARNRWLACDCLGETALPPLLAPVYITEAQTYCLRRLDRDRPAHLQTCPFYRDQVIRTPAQQVNRAAPRMPPDGFFAVLKPIAAHLAQRPDNDDETRSSRPSIPRLARLLWQLTEIAGTNTIAAIEERPAPSIKQEFARLKLAAQRLYIAPGVPLAKQLFTHQSELHSKRIYAQLRAAVDSWPSGHIPQAFLLTYASSIVGREIHFSSGDPVLVASPIKMLRGIRAGAGPYLVLVAIGDHPPVRGFAPVRAYAQPVHDGKHFVPVDTAAQRALLGVLLKLQWTLRTDQISTWIRRPLFDLESDVGLYRPEFMLAGDHCREQQRSLHVIELADSKDQLYARAPAGILDASIDGVIRISQDRLADPDRLIADLASRLRKLPHQT